MYPSAVGTSFIVQQQTSGTGRFLAAEYGRARVTIPNGDANAVVRIAAKLYGALGNSLTVEFVDRGSGIAVPATTISQTGPALRVVLRRLSGGAPLATANEVAAAINSFGAFTGTPVAAIAGGDGTGVCSGYIPQSLTGGKNPIGYPSTAVWAIGTTYLVDVDVLHNGGIYRSLQGSNVGHDPGTSPTWWRFMPAQDGAFFRWDKLNATFGQFDFEQDATLVLRQFEAVFTVPSGTHRVDLIRCPMNTAYEPIASEGVGVFRYDTLTPTTPDIAVSDVRILLPRGWCFLVVTDIALAGTVRLDMRREANFPYL